MRAEKVHIRQLLTSWGDYEREGCEGRVKSPLGRLGEVRGESSGLPPIWEPRDVTIARRILARMVDTCRAGKRYRDVITARYVRHEQPDPNVLTRAETKAAETWLDILAGRYNIGKS